MTKENDMTALIDIKAVKEVLHFEPVLSHYGIQTQGSTPQVKIICPFHDDHTASCGVNYDGKGFNCFSCGASGNELEFVCYMEDLDPENTKTDLQKGAKKALEIVGHEPNDFRYRPKRGAKSKLQEREKTRPKRVDKTENTEPQKEDDSAPAVNEPLPTDFSLTLDPDHAFFETRNITPEQVAEFGLGYCKRGIMKGRIAIPLHNEKGELIGYSGRHASDELPENTPRYKLPKGFHKNLMLFNLHRIIEQAPKHVVIVEGYWSAIRLHSEGIPVVASLGASLSDQQVELLVNAGVRSVRVIYDGDDGGRTGASEAVERLSSRMFVRKIELPDGVKPDTMDDELINQLRPR